MKMLPGMTVINTCDFNQTKSATKALAEYNGPVYLRFGRPKVPNFTDPMKKFEIGKGIQLKSGSDISLFTTGHMVWESIIACENLKKEGINVDLINITTIKPLDTEIILDSVSKTKLVVTAEEHQKLGGLGASISQLLSEKLPTFIEMVAVDDSFGESGKPKELLKKYKLDSVNIELACKKPYLKSNFFNERQRSIFKISITNFKKSNLFRSISC